MTIPKTVIWATGSILVCATAWLFMGSLAGLAMAATAVGVGFTIAARVPEPMLYRSFLLLALCLPLSVGLEVGAGVFMHIPSEVLTGVMGIAALALWRRDGFLEIILSHPLPVLWILSFALPSVLSEWPLVSLKYTAVQTCFLLVFFYLFMYSMRRKLLTERLWVMYACAMLPVAVWATWQYAGYGYNPVTIPGIFRPFLNDHTQFGAICAALAAGFSVLGILRKHPTYVFAGIFFAVATLLSGSRAAIMSLAVLPVVLLFARSSMWRRLIPAGMAVVLIAAVANRTHLEAYLEEHMPRPTAAGENVLNRLKSSANTRTDVSNLERLNRWHAALEMWKTRPHVGHGPGTYQFEYIPYQSSKYENRLTVRNYERPPEGSGGTAHSEVLLQLSENGWPSTLLFLGMLIRWLWLFAKYGRAERPLLCAAAAGLFTYYIHMPFNNFLSAASFAFLFWTMAATLEMLSHKIRRSHE